MPLPWTRPGPPIQADEDIEILYASIGQSLSHWEDIESELSHEYALCIGKMWQHEAYDEYFAKGRSGQARINTLENAAAQFFISRPNQEVEAKFQILMRATRCLGSVLR